MAETTHDAQHFDVPGSFQHDFEQNFTFDFRFSGIFRISRRWLRYDLRGNDPGSNLGRLGASLLHGSGVGVPKARLAHDTVST